MGEGREVHRGVRMISNLQHYMISQTQKLFEILARNASGCRVNQGVEVDGFRFRLIKQGFIDDKLGKFLGVVDQGVRGDAALSDAQHVEHDVLVSKSQLLGSDSLGHVVQFDLLVMAGGEKVKVFLLVL